MPATDVTPTTALLAAVEALGPRIRGAADEVERERCLPSSLLQDLKNAGLLRMWLPREVGGDAIDPLTAMQVVEAVARADGSVGWCVMVATQGALLLPHFDQDTVIHTFTREDVFAGSLAGGTAMAQDGGYRATGRWGFASGCLHATWMTGLCRIIDGEGASVSATDPPEVRLLAFPAQDCTILDTWHALGLRGTGSHDFTVTDVLVPAGLASSSNPFNNPAARRERWGGPLYRGPFIWPVRGAQALGLARHAVDLLIELAATKKPFGVAEPLRNLARVQAAVARAEATLAAVRGYLYDMVAEVWEAVQADQELSPEQGARVPMATAYTAEMCAQVVERMFRLGGTTAIYTNSPLERCFRDINTLMADQAVAPRLFEAAGRVYLGVEPSPAAR